MTSFPSSINHTTGVWANGGASKWNISTSPTQNLTDNSTKHYDLYDVGSNTTYPNNGIQFVLNGTATEVHVEGTGDLGAPTSVAIGNTYNSQTTVTISDGDTVSFWASPTTRYFSMIINQSMLFATGPTPDQYGRLPSTAVSKTVNLGRISYRASIPGENVITDPVTTPITGGYQTYNFPSAIFCPRPRTTFAEAEADRLLFENNKQNYTRNGITYGPYIFGGCLPNVLDNIYTYVELRASAPFQFNSNGDWYVNYTTHAFKQSVPDVVEIITGFSHNPAHSVLLRYNITTNTWVSVLANIQETTYTSAGSITYTNKKLTLQSVSPSSTRQWNGFSNLSNTTVNLIQFFVDVDTNIGSSSTPTQNEVEVVSNGGGKPDRYPLIMTNLFNRNRSLYSIGMTHKDTWDLFL